MKLLSLTGILCIIGLLNSCSSKSYVNRGDKMVLAGKYYHAQSMYEKGYKRKRIKSKKQKLHLKMRRVLMR